MKKPSCDQEEEADSHPSRHISNFAKIEFSENPEDLCYYMISPRGGLVVSRPVNEPKVQRTIRGSYSKKKEGINLCLAELVCVVALFVRDPGSSPGNRDFKVTKSIIFILLVKKAKHSGPHKVHIEDMGEGFPDARKAETEHCGKFLEFKKARLGKKAEKETWDESGRIGRRNGELWL
ncbi:hypothetical protein LXL04_007684 [Taraxacum kok-saghyz]